jgi:transposase
MEVSGGSHHWARELVKLGHEIRLISLQFVKPYIKGNTNEYNDAEGICEAVERPKMRFVTIKSIEQQDLQGLHRSEGTSTEAKGQAPKRRDRSHTATKPKIHRKPMYRSSVR